MEPATAAAIASSLVTAISLALVLVACACCCKKKKKNGVEHLQAGQDHDYFSTDPNSPDYCADCAQMAGYGDQQQPSYSERGGDWRDGGGGGGGYSQRQQQYSVQESPTARTDRAGGNRRADVAGSSGREFSRRSGVGGTRTHKFDHQQQQDSVKPRMPPIDAGQKSARHKSERRQSLRKFVELPKAPPRPPEDEPTLTMVSYTVV